VPAIKVRDDDLRRSPVDESQTRQKGATVITKTQHGGHDISAAVPEHEGRPFRVYVAGRRRSRHRVVVRLVEASALALPSRRKGFEVHAYPLTPNDKSGSLL